MQQLKENTLLFVGLFSSLIIIALVSWYAIGVSRETRSKASDNKLTMTVNPLSQTKAVKEEFTAQLYLNANNKDVSGIDFTIGVNTNVLRIEKFQPTSVFNSQLINTISTQSGTLRYAAVNTGSQSLTGAIHLGTLTFFAKAPGTSALLVSASQGTIAGSTLPVTIVFDETPQYMVTEATTTVTATLSAIVSISPTINQSLSITPIINISPTIHPQQSYLWITAFYHGIGKGGDNVNQNSIGNFNPLHKERTVKVSLFNPDGEFVTSTSAIVVYDETNGNFKGSVSLQNLPSGRYSVFLRSPYYLQRSVIGTPLLEPGKVTSLAAVRLVTGDVNNDNALSILDYNQILDCYSDSFPARNCDEEKKISTDITDDGNINLFDLNQFLREFSVQNGE